MATFHTPTQTWREIDVSGLLPIAVDMHDNGRRLLQLFCTYVDKHYELVYMFDLGDYNVENIKLICEPDELVPSIGDLYPYATPYENEAIELFGVKINVKMDGYRHRLYRIEDETPYVSPYEKASFKRD
ncbi:MAG: NADH-quinone oxidoreductase subunit C [Lachnospiraceae bacterium]|nr:NADH-quinone oxidoreductase subunit C [Lachnospiraceae bacterium]